MFTPLLLSAAQGGLTASGDGAQALNVGAGTAAVDVASSGAATQALDVGAGNAQVGSGSSDASGAVTQALQLGAGTAQVAVAASGAAVQLIEADGGTSAVAVTCSGAATQALQVGAGGGTVWAPTAMPSSAIVFFDPSTLGLADGAPCASFTDSIGGYVATQAVGAKQPTFKANAKAGRPGLVFDGTQFLSFDGTGPLKTAIDGGDFSVMMLISDVGATSIGSVFGASGGGTAFNMIANGAYIGRDDGNITGHTVPWTKSDFITLTVTSENLTAGNYGGMGVAFERDYVNGATCYRSTNAVVPGTTAQFALGAQGAGGTSLGKFTLLGLVAYPRHLAPVEVLQLEISLRQHLNQPLPFGGLARFDVGDGDSIVDQVGVDPQYGFHYLMEQQRGHKYGQWTNLSIGAIRAQQSTAKFQEIADFLNYLGIPGNLTYFEYVNGKNAARTNTQLIQDLKDYVSTVRFKAPSARLNMADSTAYGDDVSVHPYATNRGLFNAAFADASTGLAPVSDAITRISLDPLIGDGNAYTNYGATYIQPDTVHPSIAGHAQLATLLLPGLNALDTATNSFGTGQAVQSNAGSGTAGVQIVASGAVAQALDVGAGTAGVADPGEALSSGAATNGNVGAGSAQVSNAIVCSGAALQALATAAGMGLVSVDCAGAALQAIAAGHGTAHVVVVGQEIQATSGYVALHRKHTWTTRK